MPSRLIHYIIAEELQKELGFRNVNRFFIGSICPDLSISEDGSKKQSHFSKKQDKYKGRNWNAFFEKYEDKMREDELYQGIFCHIITDALWFHDVSDPLIRKKCETIEDARRKFSIGYEDFHRLNYILSQEWGLEYHLTKEDIEYEGLHLELYDYFLDEMKNDIEDEPVARKNELQIYDYDTVSKFITKCVGICKRELKAFYTGEKLIDATEYYVAEQYELSKQ